MLQMQAIYAFLLQMGRMILIRLTYYIAFMTKLLQITKDICKLQETSTSLLQYANVPFVK